MPGFDINPVEAGTAPAPVNPLATIGQLAEVQNVVNQNKMFPLAYQTGQVQLQRNQQELTNLQIGNLRNVIESVPPGSTPADYATAVQQGVDSKLYSQDLASSYAGGALTGIDLPHWQSLAKRSAIATGSEAAQNAQFGTPTPVSTGAGTQFENVNRVTGQVTPEQGTGAFVPNALGPKDLATPVETVDENGTKTMGVLGDYIDQTGKWKDGVPHPMTALGPLSANAQASLGSAYGPQIAAFENSQNATANARQAVENARQEAADFTTGPMSDQFAKWGEFLSEFGIPAPKFASMPETAAREAFRQSLIQVLRGQQAALHMDQTDAARQTAGLDVPGSITTPAGMKIVLGTIEGNYDAQLAMGKAWQQQKAKGGASSWGAFQTEFPAKVPPSIFQAQYNPEQIAEQQKGWSAAQKADWQRRYDLAKKLGWLPADAR